MEELYEIFLKNSIIDTDSRNIRKGSIFFALKGENFNGNKFAEEAILKGASFAVIDEKEFKKNENFILVLDALETLQKLANFHRKKLKIPILGITGSNGKTTTKELIKSVLSQKYKVFATQGNLNNHIGVPLTLLSMNTSHDFGVIEMGASGLKEIEFLCNISEPDFGLITSFGMAHIQGFKNFEGVVKTKSELYDFLKKNNGVIFVNPSDEIQLEKSKGGKVVEYGQETFIESSTPFLKISYGDLKMESKLVGSYNYNNILSGIYVGEYFNVDKNLIKIAIENYSPTNNRSQLVKNGSNNIILDCYNANPTSMKLALENLTNFQNGKRIAILGDMFELGNISEIEHQKIVDYVIEIKLDQVFFIGNNFFKTKSGENLPMKFFQKMDDAKIYFKGNVNFRNSTILMKGSRSIGVETIYNEFFKNNDKKLNLLILCGGPGPEHQISLCSAKNTIPHFSKEKYNIMAVCITKEKNWITADPFFENEDFTTLDNTKISTNFREISWKGKELDGIPIDLAFPIIHGEFGEDGEIQSFFENRNIPCVGFDSKSSKITINKFQTKKIIEKKNICNVVKSILINKHEEIPLFDDVQKELGNIIFIKPNRQGSSFGCGKCTQESEYLNQLNECFKFGDEALLETFQKFKEVEISILGNDQKSIQVSVPGIVNYEDEFYSYEAKYVKKAEEPKIPANFSKEMIQTIQDISKNIYLELGGKGFARIDYFVNGDQIYFNEINTIPGMTPISMFMKLWNFDGISTSEVLDMIIDFAIKK
jgi:UDP-N-acetylmuramoyl-tripeptide--D-alanyl-D-alanine ligase